MTSKPESFRNLTKQLARASAWLEKTGWPTRAQDVATANRLYVEWLALTDAHWLSSGERDRYPLITALDEAFSRTHDAEALTIYAWSSSPPLKFARGVLARTARARINDAASDGRSISRPRPCGARIPRHAA